jgi:hypothetical protein
MSENHPEEAPLRARNIHSVILEAGGTELTVDHVYLPEGMAGQCCHEDCLNPAHDPGLVGLGLDDKAALLTAEEALTLANRLTRAANLIFESEEDRPDIERDMARFGAPQQEDGQR